MKKQIYTVTTLLFLLSVIPIVNAAGLSVLPAFIKISNLIRGQQFNTTITINNLNNYEQTFSINTTDEIADWVSFYSMENSDEQINQITIPSDSSKNIIANFKIPKDAPNGKYSSKIYVGSAAGTSGENASALVIRVPITVSLEVTGEQLIAGNVIKITTTDTEINQLLKIKVEFQNTGEVIATPRIEVVIERDGEELANFIYNKTSVNVGNKDTIDIDWNTAGLTVGDYIANVKIYLANKMIEEKDLNFKILDIGNLNVETTVTKITIPEKINESTNLTGKFILNFDPFIAFAIAIIIGGFLIGVFLKSKFS